jgi:hypothetical protein
MDPGGTKITGLNRYTLVTLRLILPFTNADVSRHILMLYTSVFMKDNIDQREYNNRAFSLKITIIC